MPLSKQAHDDESIAYKLAVLFWYLLLDTKDHKIKKQSIDTMKPETSMLLVHGSFHGSFRARVVKMNIRVFLRTPHVLNYWYVLLITCNTRRKPFMKTTTAVACFCVFLFDLIYTPYEVGVWILRTPP